MSRAEALSSIRTTLRHLRRLPSTSTPSSPLRVHILSLLRNSNSTRFEGSQIDTEAETERFRRMLVAYAENVTSVTQLSHLRGLDTGEKMTQSDRVKAMASRVGLGTPQEYSEELQEQEQEQEQRQ